MNRSTDGMTTRLARMGMATALGFGGLAALATMGSADPVDAHVRGRRTAPEVLELGDARLKFEINATDGDGGVQLFLDGEQWRWISMKDPAGRPVLSTRMTGSLGLQGGTELFLESAEPTFDELSLDELLERFPEGDYQVAGRTVDGRRIAGVATLSHRLPDGPILLAPIEGDGPTDPAATSLRWQAVDAPDGGSIIAYQVIVVDPDTDTPALPKRTLDITVPADTTSLTVPDGFLEPDTGYEWEVLAIDDSGNQTLSSSSLVTGH